MCSFARASTRRASGRWGRRTCALEGREGEEEGWEGEGGEGGGADGAARSERICWVRGRSAGGIVFVVVVGFKEGMFYNINR